MENKELISAFFAKNKKEIADNGFSKKVITRLPETRDKQWIVLIMAALGTSLTILSGYYSGLFNFIYTFLQQVSPIVIVGAIAAFPLVSLLIIFTQKN